ncbi:hypothetical protein Kpol_1002p121 [Vanderwaltozyma polyspora DSM 70294]|uniref:Aminopeptidase n=1 Tax=Vanderwaltozyma polyspora (strain ATCC 22028 / DSM 70294 / BCRC 21397 / CBS 2163 / NBRC 10782 / NRRL Y-8283 / UCD 57-17) TaxID=436907 RepID=A7TEE9_VANPO|nr:uncharacterized protein Kpol_1002p121 [Vanderwaltozyma polyspora DSM 70294]EDO19471.1 hypothetical protein Kpol_1002p121 [Vanderwaltozyma polyspora DSM 70294]
MPETNTVELLSLGSPIIPINYKLDLEIDPAKANFKGECVVTFNSRENLFNSFKLHAKDLVIASATIGDYQLKVKYEKEQEIAIFSHDTPIDVSNHNEILIKYVGKINGIKTHQDKTVGVFKTNFMDDKTGSSDNVVVATHCQPCFARYIFPCIDEPSNKSSFKLTLRTLKKLQVIGNTKIESIANDSLTDFQVVSFTKTVLMTTSLFGFVIGDLDFIKTEVKMPISGTDLPIAVYAPNNVELATFTLNTIQKYLPLLESYFNKCYPLDKLDFALLPFLNDMAMENFGLVTILQDHLLLPPKALGNKFIRQQSQQLIVHELVHQWMGNYITFDSWEHLWFNESFATWLACHLIDQEGDTENYWSSFEYLKQLETTMESDIDVKAAKSISGSAKKITTVNQTSDAFDAYTYTKGITILRMIQKTVGDEILKESLQKIIGDEERFHAVSCKPIDIWTEISKMNKSENIVNFFSSWTRLQGFPLITVTTDQNSNTKLTQHRFVIKGETDDEDIPYHVPLFILKRDGTIDNSNVLMTDRSIELKEAISLINSGHQGYYRVSYESDEHYVEIRRLIEEDKLEVVEVYKIMEDLCYVMNNYGKEVHESGLLTLMDCIIDREDYWSAVSIGLQMLSQRKLTDNLKYKKMLDKLVSKMNWNSKPSELDEDKVSVMAQLMYMYRDDSKMYGIAEQYCKKLLQGPSNSIHNDMVGSVISVISTKMSMKQYKQIISLTSNNAGIMSHIYLGEPQSVVTQLIENIGYSRNYEIVKKILHYVNDHISTIAHIDKMLLGVCNNHGEIVKDKETDVPIHEMLWEWFTTQNDNWNNKWNKTKNEYLQSGITNVSVMVLQSVLPHSGSQVSQYVSERPNDTFLQNAYKIVSKSSI